LGQAADALPLAQEKPPKLHAGARQVRKDQETVETPVDAVSQQRRKDHEPAARTLRALAGCLAVREDRLRAIAARRRRSTVPKLPI
jgi:hypothetical protein